MRVFGDHERNSTERHRPTESIFEFYDRIGVPWFAAIRDAVEGWCQRLPSEMRERIVGELRSENDERWRSAFWEIYLYVLLDGLGYQPEPHPQIPGQKQTPDFRFTSGGRAAYIEARSLSGSRRDLGRKRQRRNVEAAIEAIGHPQWSVWLTIAAEGAVLPSLGSLASKVTNWLDSLEKLIPAVLGRSGPQLEIEDKGWRIRLEAVPKPVGAAANPNYPMIVGQGPAGMQLCRDADMLKRAVRKKCSQCPAGGAPYAIAVLFNHTFLDDEDVMSALFGSTSVRITMSGDGDIVMQENIRREDGAWRGPTGWALTRVSAVIVARGLNECTVLTSIPEIWFNPKAEYEFDIPLPFPMKVVDAETGRLVRTAAAVTRPMHAMLGLTREWPGPGDP